MTTYEVTVDGQRVDTRNLNINIKLTHFDPYNLALRGSAFTYSFDLPTTKRNNEVFGHRNDWLVIGKFNTKYTGRVYVNSDLIIEGRLIITSIDNNNYKVSIYNNDWIAPLKEKSLRDLVNYTAPFTGIFGTPEQATIQDYIDRSVPSDKIAFPLISYGTFYNPYKRIFYLLDVTGNRAGFLPSGSYSLQDGTCFDIVDGVQVDYWGQLYSGEYTIYIGEGYHKVWELPKTAAAPTIDVECYYEKYYTDELTDTRCNVLGIEDYTPSFYYLEIIKKIFADAGISVQGKIFEDERYTKLVLPYIGTDEFQWNWNRLGYYYGINEFGRSEIDDRVEIVLPVILNTPIKYDRIANYPFTEPIGPVLTYAVWPDGYFDAQGTNRFFYDVTAVSPVKQTFIINYNVTGTNIGQCMRTELTQSQYSVEAFGSMQHSQYIVPTTGSYSGRCRVDLDPKPIPTYPTNVSLRPDNFITPTGSVRNRVMLGIFRTEGLADFSTIDDNYLQIGWNGFTSDKVLASVELTDDITYIVNGGSYELEFNNIILNENDRIFVAITMLGAADIGAEPYWSVIGLETTYSEFEVMPDQYNKDTNPQGFSWDIDIARNLPDTKQIDFVKNFMFMFNQYYEYDPASSTITFRSFSDYTNSTIFPPIDLDRYSSTLNASAEKPPVYDKLEVGYTYDENDYLISKVTRDKYNYIIKDTDPDESYEYLVNFAPTEHRPFLFENDTFISLPSIADEENYFKPSEEANWHYNYVPRLILNQGRNKMNKSVNYSKVNILIATIGGREFYNYLPQGIYFGTGVFPNYLNFNNIYTTLYDNIFDNMKESHIVNVKGILRPNDFKELSKHIRLVKWNNDTYIILEATYNVLNGVTNYKLLKYV